MSLSSSLSCCVETGCDGVWKTTGVNEQNAKALGHLWATEPIRSVLECPFNTFPFVRPKFITFYYYIRRHNNDLNRQSINDRNRNIQSFPGYKKKIMQRIKNMNLSSPDSSSNHTMNLSFPNSMVKTCLLRYAWSYVHCMCTLHLVGPHLQSCLCTCGYRMWFKANINLLL